MIESSTPEIVRLRRVDWILTLAFLLVTAQLVFPGLGERALWEDEAETALIARGILDSGLPSAWDGHQLVTQLGGNDLSDSLISVLVPWAERYFAGLGLALAGDDAFGARLPFALLGCLCVALSYLLALRMTGDRWLAIFATLLLTSSVQYLLLARQCRYYMLVMFSALVALWVYRSLAGRRDVVVLSLALSLMFHSNYGSFACFGGGLALHALWLDRDPVRLRRLALAALGVGLLTTPWFFGFNVLARVFNTPVDRPAIFREFVLSLFVINQYVLPWLVALGLALVGGRFRSRYRATYALAGCMIVVALAGLPLLLWANPRYLPYLLFLGSVVMAGVAREVHMWNAAAGYAVAAMLWLTSLPAAVVPSLLPRSLGADYLNGEVTTGLSALETALPRRDWGDYLDELRTPYLGADEAIVAFLNEYAGEDDFVYATHNRLPIMFHTRRRIVGLLTPETLERRGWKELPGYLSTLKDADWLVLRRGGPDSLHHPRDLDLLNSFSRHGYAIAPHELPVRDVGWANRPMLSAHAFTARPPEKDKNVVIFSLTPPE